MIYGLPDEVVGRIILTITSERRVEGVVLYGSRAKGTYRDGSDIDLCLDAPELDYSSLMRLENTLDDLLLPWKIDLAIRDRIDNPDLLDHIGRVGKLLFSRRVA
jgi:uncharacterized protein